MNSGKTFFVSGVTQQNWKVFSFLTWKRKKRKGDKGMLQDYSSSIVIHIPYCLCIVIEGRGEFPKKGKKKLFP